jgi:hypothetical protein
MRQRASEAAYTSPMSTEPTIVKTYLDTDIVVPGPWRTITDIKRANAESGGLFFSTGKGKAQAEIRHGRFIVTADEDFDGERVYNTHAVLDSGRIEFIGALGGYQTIEDADAGLESALAEGPALTPVDVAQPGPALRPSSLSSLSSLADDLER